MNGELNWDKLCKVGGVAALVIVLLIPIQILFFVVYPPPETTLGFFELFHKNWMVGLLSLDVLYYINNGLFGLFVSERLLWVDSDPIGLPNPPQIVFTGCASQQRPPPPLARSHHDGIARQNATLTPTVTLRPIKGAAFLMNEVWA